jgi:hypothetical protein
MFTDNQGTRRFKLMLVAASVAIFFAATFTYAQEGTREIKSSDFTNDRPLAAETGGGVGASGGGRTAPARKPRTYRRVSKAPLRIGKTNTGSPQPARNEIAQLGVTIWRLRPARSTDTGRRQFEREKNNTTEWIPERIEADTLIRAGNRVRLSIESPHTGYLYVVNRDEFAGGRSGAINLIFPLAGEDNRVYAGRLIDIPSPESSMKANPAPNQSGEVLSIIVSSKPLNLPLSDNVLPISSAQLSEWERVWGGDTEMWEMEGGAGETWTVAEQQAAAKTGRRQLTRDDPPPQTIYRVSTSDIKAMLVNVRLRYGK